MRSPTRELVFSSTCGGSVPTGAGACGTLNASEGMPGESGIAPRGSAEALGGTVATPGSSRFASITSPGAGPNESGPNRSGTKVSSLEAGSEGAGTTGVFLAPAVNGESAEITVASASAEGKSDVGSCWTLVVSSMKSSSSNSSIAGAAELRTPPPMLVEAPPNALMAPRPGASGTER